MKYVGVPACITLQFLNQCQKSLWNFNQCRPAFSFISQDHNLLMWQKITELESGDLANTQIEHIRSQDKHTVPRLDGMLQESRDVRLIKAGRRRGRR